MSLGLYLHIPFCQSICTYCNFNRGLFDGALAARYAAALEREIRDAGDGRPVDTIFFGGGTPSLLDPEEIARLLGACRTAYAVDRDAEVTLEANPETITDRRLEAFLKAGVNRLSFGVQSFDDGELRRLGRIHSAARAAEAIGLARAAGFSNVSLDLMLWLPGQSPASWARTVDRAIALAPDHLSMYLLELYPNAPIKEAMARASQAEASGTSSREWAQLADDAAADLYLQGLERLDAAGYTQYEISNVARPGRASRHNLKYWQAGEWRGVGCGAHSTTGGVRWHNVYATEEYVEAISSGQPVARGVRQLSKNEQMQDALITGLRLTQGIHRGNFASRYGVDPWTSHGEALAACQQAGYVWVNGLEFGLTRQGMLVANEILCRFV